THHFRSLACLLISLEIDQPRRNEHPVVRSQLEVLAREPLLEDFSDVDGHDVARCFSSPGTFFAGHLYMALISEFAKSTSPQYRLAQGENFIRWDFQVTRNPNSARQVNLASSLIQQVH